MAALVTQVTGAVGTVSLTLPIPMRFQLTQPISLLVNFSGNPITPAQGTVTVQISNDPNANPANAANNPAALALARWNAHDVLVLLSNDKNNSIVYPVAYVRLIVVQTVTGIVTLQIGLPDPLP